MDTANMPKLIEYRDLTPELRAVKTELRKETRRDSYGNTHEWTIWHKAPGYERAGSVARLVSRELWGLTTIIDGNSHGAWLRSLAEIEELIGFKGERIA